MRYNLSMIDLIKRIYYTSFSTLLPHLFKITQIIIISIIACFYLQYDDEEYESEVTFIR